MNATKWAVWSLCLCVPCMGQKYVDIRVRPERQTWEAEPMATGNFWKSTDGDATAAASWTEGHVPTNGEFEIYDGRVHTSVMTNVAASGVGGDELIVKPEFLGDIGSPGVYYDNVDTNTDKITIRGPGSFYLAPTISGDTIVDNDACYVELNNVLLQNLDVKAGTVKITANSTFRGGARVVTYGDTAHLTIEASSGATWPGHIACLGGTLTNKDESDAGDSRFICSGGIFRQEGLIETLTYVIVTGGIFQYVPSSSPAGQSPNLYILDGVMDVRDSQFPIPYGRLIVGPNAEVWGSALEVAVTASDLDLRLDYP